VVTGVLYEGAGQTVFALKAATGKKLWSFTTGGFVNTSPAVASGVVYVGSGDGTLYALKAASGSKLRGFAAAGAVHLSPAVANGVVY
jgi:outer membrane protein assembly factor BamB